MSEIILRTDVHVTICIGLYGICLLGTVNDEHEQVTGHVERDGLEQWFESLPDHDAPVVDGIYTLVLDVTSDNDDTFYNLVSVRAGQ